MDNPKGKLWCIHDIHVEIHDWRAEKIVFQSSNDITPLVYYEHFYGHYNVHIV